MKPPSRTPSGRRGPQQGKSGGVLLGMMLVAQGRKEGIACFVNSGDGVLSALAPWIAFLLVGGALSMMRSHSAAPLGVMLLSLCAVLAPPVATELLARLWGRREIWARYAAAALWCDWLMVIAYAAGLVVASLMVQLGVIARIAAFVFAAIVMAYWIWLHWFVGRHGLRIGGGQAALLTLCVFGISVLLLFGTLLIDPRLALAGLPHRGMIAP